MADQASVILERPDWVLHLPPTPVNDATVRIDFRCDDVLDDFWDEHTGARPSLKVLGDALKERKERNDTRPRGLRFVGANYADLQNPAHLQKYIIRPLGGHRKVRLPKAWLEVTESGFSYESNVPGDDASPELYRIFAKYPNAALHAEEQGLSRWLIAADLRLEWNCRALSHGITTLQLRSCRLRPKSIPTLVFYIEGNGTLRRLDLTNNQLLQEPDRASLLARSFRSSVVAELRLSSNPVDDTAESLQAFLTNLNSTCLHTLRLSHILSDADGDVTMWDNYDSENEETWNEKEEEEAYSDSSWSDDSEEEELMEANAGAGVTPQAGVKQDEERKSWLERQALKEDQAALALSAFIRRSIPSRVGLQQPSRGEELAPSFCGCPNLSKITWKGNEDSLLRKLDGQQGLQGLQHPNLLLVIAALVGDLVHLDRETVAALGDSSRTMLDPAGLKLGSCATDPFEAYNRPFLPSGSLIWDSLISGDLNPNRLSIDTPRIRNMLRSVRIARQNTLSAMSRKSSFSSAEPPNHAQVDVELDSVELETAVDRDTKEFGRAIQALSSLDRWRGNVVKLHSTRLVNLQRERMRSAFIVLAAARKLGCQVKPLASRQGRALPGWLRLPPEIRRLCIRTLIDIHVSDSDDLGLCRALSQSQMQNVLSFACDRRTIGYGRVNEVLLASKRLADEAAVEAQRAKPRTDPSKERMRSTSQSMKLPINIFDAPNWSWKKAAERCMPQDWVTQVACANRNELQFPPPREYGPLLRAKRTMPPEALAFLSVTDCKASRES